jgi:hypothetical protein
MSLPMFFERMASHFAKAWIALLMLWRGVRGGFDFTSHRADIWQSLWRSRVLRWLYDYVSARHVTPFNSYLLTEICAVTDLCFKQQRLVEAEWQKGRSVWEVHEKHKSALILTWHNRGISPSVVHLANRSDRVAVVSGTKAALTLRGFYRSGLQRAGSVQVIERDGNTLLHLRDVLEKGKIVFSAVDYTAHEADLTFDRISPNMFRFAEKFGTPVFILNYGVSNEGRVLGDLTGPVDAMSGALEQLVLRIKAERPGQNTTVAAYRR